MAWLQTHYVAKVGLKFLIHHQAQTIGFLIFVWFWFLFVCFFVWGRLRQGFFICVALTVLELIL